MDLQKEEAQPKAAVAECSAGNSRRSLVAADPLRHDAAEFSHLLRISWNLTRELWTSWQTSCRGSRGSWSHHSRPRSVGCRETDSPRSLCAKRAVKHNFLRKAA